MLSLVKIIKLQNLYASCGRGQAEARQWEEELTQANLLRGVERLHAQQHAAAAAAVKREQCNALDARATDLRASVEALQETAFALKEEQLSARSSKAALEVELSALKSRLEEQTAELTSLKSHCRKAEMAKDLLEQQLSAVTDDVAAQHRELASVSDLLARERRQVALARDQSRDAHALLISTQVSLSLSIRMLSRALSPTHSTPSQCHWQVVRDALGLSDSDDTTSTHN